ncbi:MAG: Ig-like domain-containing protein [Firmicutes bacterium]|nr:Ig-like domain-containing protein [Bacillota bacterium]
MKSLKKLLAVLVVVTLMAGMIAVPAFAASFKYEDEAKVLYDLGLFKGKSETEYKPALEERLLREEGVALLLRLFKLEEEALKMDEKEAKDLLKQKFKDADDIAAWAVKYVAYAVKNGIVAGRPDGKFAPKDNLIGREFAKMVLAQLGYKQGVDFDYKFSTVELSNASGLPKAEASRMDEAVLLRDDVVGMSFYSLLAEYVAGTNKDKTVIEVVVGKDEKMKAIAIEAGLMEEIKIVKLASLEEVKIKVGEELTLPAKVKATYSDGKVEDIAVKWDVSKVDTTKAGEYKAVGTVENFEGKVEVKVTVLPIELVALSATAGNMKEIVVSFNTELDATTVVKDNFAVAGQTVSSVALLDSKKDVLVTIAGNFSPNPSDFEITVKNVKNIYGKAVAETKLTGKAFDVTIPEAVSITFVGPNAVEIGFSEYLDPTVLGSVTINNGIYGVNSVAVSGKKVTVEIGTNLPDGNYSFKVQGFKDYAGFLMPVKTFDVAYAADKTNPTASIKEATQTYVVVQFNKPVKGMTTADFYHTYTAWQPLELQSGGAVYDPTKAVSEIKLVFVDALKITPAGTTASDRPVPVGNTSLVMKKTDSIVDLWGNKLAGDITLPLSVTADVTAPEVTNVEVVAENQIKVTFSKEVITPTTSNFVFKTAAGDAVSTTFTVSYASKVATINFASKLAGGVYTVEIKDIKDTSLAGNSLVPVVKELTITDKTPHDTNATRVEYIYTPVDANGDTKNDNPFTMYIYYNEKMATEGANSVLNADNYRISYDGGTTYNKFPSNTSLSVFIDSSRIKVVIPVGSFTYNDPPDALLIGRVADAAGNLADVLTYSVAVTTPVAPPAIQEVQSISKNTIKMILSTELKSINASKIAISESTDLSGLDFTQAANMKYLAAAANYVNKDGKAEVTITLKADNNLADTESLVGYVRLLDDNNMKSLLDMQAVPGTYVKKVAGVGDFTATDKFAPAILAKTAIDGEKTITIQFTEALEEVSVYKYTFTVKNRTVTGITASGDTVTITLADNNVAGTKYEITQVYPIKDAAGNEFKATSVIEVTATAAP